jgi:hypothetical protein
VNKQYGLPFFLPGLNREAAGAALTPLPYTTTKDQGGFDENWLENLIAAHPEILPFDQIDPAFADAVSICTQLPVGANALDNFLVTDRGGLVLVECKLWRNPESRRKVVGQILDYATDIAGWDYEQLENAVRHANPAPGLSKGASLFERVAGAGGLDEKQFADAVYRNLKRGQFLLLVVGDGIREGVASISSFLQQHVGLHFDLGLAEIAVFPLPTGGYIVQPRVLAVTERILRGVVVLTDDRVQVQPPPEHATPQKSVRVAGTISEEIIFDSLDGKQPGLGTATQRFLERLKATGITTIPTAMTIKLMGEAAGELWPLGAIDSENAHVWLEQVTKRASRVGKSDDALKYYTRLVRLLDDEALRIEKLKPGTVSGTRSLPLTGLLVKQDQWIEAIREYLAALQKES